MHKPSASLFLSVSVALAAIHAHAHAFDTEMLVNSGPSSNRLDLVILGDGYRAEDQAQLTTDANAILNVLFAEDLWSAYRNYINVKLVHVESVETGADAGSAGGTRDTALGAFFNCAGTDRLLCVDSTAVLNIAMADAPEYDQILIVVNDTKYGGSGGQFATTSIAPSASDIAVHEIGHSLFDLADEYSDAFAYPACDPASDCPEPNASLYSTFADIKWNEWIEPTTPLPTPDVAANEALIGAFEGARYQTTGVFRPARNCLMRVLGRHLCSVCSQAGVLSMYSFADPTDSLAPAGPVSFTTAETQQFRVDGPRPTPNTLSFVWQVDGTMVATNDTGVLDLAGSSVSPGNHTLTVTIADLTQLVRDDPGSVLVSTNSWTFSVSSAADWRSFDDPSRPWTTVFPFSVVNVPDASDGPASLQVNGCFFVPIRSPAFNTNELTPSGTQIALDVKLPALQVVPVWSGNLQILVTIPDAWLFNVFVGNVTLIGVPRNSWQTVTMTVPRWLRPILEGDHPNSRITIAHQNANCLQPMLIDNLRYLP